MTIRESYYYLFYKFYKVGEMSISIFPNDFISAAIILWLELIFLISLKFYYRDFVDSNDRWELVSFETFIPIVILVGIKYWAFFNDDKWKIYFKKFDKFPTDKNEKGTLIVACIFIIIIVNLVISISIH